ncbi:MAG: NAD-dependent epimerase/dehydratase family protein [Albimonas sp.]|uniref:NAD-dependent epimerase/dehydratase family protein n=1 Tax=Albimonas sp. TaxID=1872425 RepID=UPI0040565DAC
MATYLITGGRGFIGRALVQDLAASGATVRILDSLVEQVHGASPPPAREDVEFLQGDLRDPGAVDRALEGVDGVFHLAAEVGVGQSMYEIARYVATNDLGTAVLLEGLLRRPVRRLVVASSMSIYGEGLNLDAEGARAAPTRRQPRDLRAGRWAPIDAQGRPLEPAPTDEATPPDLASIYALTKYAQERACLIFGGAYETEAVALRLFNVFGPGQALSNPYTGVLANFGSRLVHGARPTVFEDGNQTRDFVHVRDVARAFRLAMERPEAAGQAINIGAGRAYSIADVATMLARAMGAPELEPEILGRFRAGDIRHCFADITRAREVLGYAPEHALEDSLDELVEWIRAEKSEDRGPQMRRELEARGLVS